MNLTQVLVTRQGTLTHVFYGEGEAAVDAGVVTVVVRRLDGTLVASGAATPGGTGQYSFTLPPQAQLDLLTAAWTGVIDGASVVETDLVEIISGYYFSLAAARGSDQALADAGKWPTELLADRRQAVETELERITERAFVPRFARVLLDGTGTSELILPDADIRSVRTVLVAPSPGDTPVALTVEELAKTLPRRDSTLVRTDGRVFTTGPGTVIVEYEHGQDSPSAELVDASLLRLRYLVTRTKTGIPDRAASFTAANGGTYRLTQAGAKMTGIPDVDAVYHRYGRGGPGGNAPAHRTLDYDPQRGSLFHGGRR